MISFVEPLSSGNAIRLYITPPAGASSWRVLRRTSAAAFTGHDDTGAVLVATCRDNVILDDKALVNGIPYAYRVFYFAPAGALVAQDDAQGTPAASYAGDDLDTQGLVRARLEAGLAVEVQRGMLFPASGKIPVVTSPFALVDKITFPCVSIHLDSDSSSDFAVGDAFGDVQVGGIGGWEDSIGWLSRVQLNVISVSLNGDERIALRKAIRRVMQANLEVFYSYGLRNIEFGMRDSEDEGPQNAILYMSTGSFGCIAPSVLSSPAGEIADVTVTGTAGW